MTDRRLAQPQAVAGARGAPLLEQRVQDAQEVQVQGVERRRTHGMPSLPNGLRLNLMTVVHVGDDRLSFVTIGQDGNRIAAKPECSAMEADVVRYLMAFLMMCMLAGSLTACDGGSMSPVSYGGDAPGDINSNHH